MAREVAVVKRCPQSRGLLSTIVVRTKMSGHPMERVGWGSTVHDVKLAYVLSWQPVIINE